MTDFHICMVGKRLMINATVIVLWYLDIHVHYSCKFVSYVYIESVHTRLTFYVMLMLHCICASV